MIPENRLGDIDRRSQFSVRVRTPLDLLVDYEQGGVALQDASQGLQVQLWTLRYEDGDFLLSAENVPETVLFSRPGVEQIGLAFDNNMAPFVAFQDAGGVACRWFDPSQGEFVISDYLPAGSHSPRCTLDEKRELLDPWRDIILAYLRDGNLYYRQQRDNYGIERLLTDEYDLTRLAAVGMNRQNSLQFWVYE